MNSVQRTLAVCHLMLFLWFNMSAHDGCMGLDSVCMPRQSGQPRLSSSEMGGNEDRKSVVLLKTNMLYDAIAVPNIGLDRKSTRLNSSHTDSSRMPSSA